MIILNDSKYGEDVASLRAKTSHSWLDHEVSMVPDAVALTRWRAGSWCQIAVRWKSLHSIAVELGQRLDEFSASTLVDKLSAFQSLAMEDKASLKRQLAALHHEMMNVVVVRAVYDQNLTNLWRAAECFFELATQPYDSRQEQGLVDRWRKVREVGMDLRAMFVDGRIPAGILLP